MKSEHAYRTITEVAELLQVQPSVLRFWETKFDQIKPMKRSGGRRYYRPDDVELIKTIKTYLYDKRYTIEGVQKLFKSKGLKAILGEEIQKDFFETAPQEIEIDDKSRKILVELNDKLKAVKATLQEAVETAKS